MNTGHDRLLLLAGNLEELRQQLAVDKQFLLERDDVMCPPLGGPCRLAMVNADAQRLAVAQRIIEGGTPWRGRKDIWFTTSPLLGDDRGGVALMFPGLEQRFDPSTADVAEHFCMEHPDLNVGEQSVRQHSIAVLAVGQLLDKSLRKIGVVPAAVAGHSIGEWDAMISAGLISSASLDSFIAGASPEVFELPTCVFAALATGIETAEEAIAGVTGVVVTHDNCPHQSIICGEQTAVATVMERLKKQGISSRLLNFRSGFHSPFLLPYMDWVSNVAKLPLGPAATSVWSATTAQPFPTNEPEIRELIIRHLLEPVRFRTLIENLYASGIRAFVQVGVGSISSFIDDTLAGRNYVAVAANVAGQPGMRQLRRTAAALWVEGAQLQLDQLAEPQAILATA